jgi:type IV secretory pathway component VirB8
MSEYQVKKLTDEFKPLESIKFDKKEDAEHFAKNQSALDTENIYEVLINQEGKFIPVKTYQRGDVIDS